VKVSLKFLDLGVCVAGQESLLTLAVSSDSFQMQAAATEGVSEVPSPKLRGVSICEQRVV